MKRETEAGDEKATLSDTGTKFTSEFAEGQHPVLFLLLLLAGNRQAMPFLLHTYKKKKTSTLHDK